MGYSFEYEEQFRILKSIENNLSDVEDELKILVTIVDFVNKAWTSDAGEKYYIITAIQQVRKGLAKDIRELRTFSLSSKYYLNQMKEFEKYSPRIIKGSCSISNISASKSKKTKVICDLTEMMDVQEKLKSCSRRLKRLTSNINNNLSKVDSTMANAVAGGKSIIRKYQKDITVQANCIDRIAKAISQIVDNYKKAEENVKRVADGLKSGTIVAVTANGIISNEGSQNFDNWIKSVNTKNATAIKIDLKGLSNVFGNVDHMISDTKEIYGLMKKVSNQKIPVVSKFLSTYGDVKETGDMLYDMAEKVSNGENPFKAITARDLANVVEKYGDAIFGTAGVGYLAGTAFSFTDNYLERLQGWYDSGETDIVKGTWHIWGGAISDTINDKVQGHINGVKDGITAVYDMSDTIAGFIGIDLDAEYQKYGINVRESINDVAAGTKSVIDAGTRHFKGGLGYIGKTISSWV